MLKQFINLLFPPKCVFCGELLAFNSKADICNLCLDKIPFLPDEIYKLGPAYSFDSVICLCEYTGIIKDAIKRFKFHNKSHYYRTFGRLLSDKIKKVTRGQKFDIIISVPLHKERQISRGYNQSYLISSFISKELKIKEKSYCITRVKNTNVQSLTKKEGRYLNVKDAFKARYPKEIEGKSIIIVDDILTTGNTLSECSRVLKESGAKDITVVAIASGKKFI
ncbi:MAG: ComF family protein [Bacillota bacterium]|nr:ComF family protein [Bacillota bacterium]